MFEALLFLIITNKNRKEKLMKIFMFSIRNDELSWIKDWEQDHPEISIKICKDPLDEKTVDQTQGYDAVSLLQHNRISEEILQKLSLNGVKIIALRTTGYENIDFNLTEKYHLAVSNVAAYSPRAIAELVLTQSLRLVRHVGILEAQEKQGNFTWQGLEALEIRQLTVGIIGTGQIGMTVAKLFKALGARIIGYDLYPRKNVSDILEYESLDTVIQKADILTLHTQLTPETKGLINLQRLKEMKKTAFLINMARGEIVNTADLITALKNQEIAGAALDTIEGETGIFGEDLSSGYEAPLLKELLSLPNVSITPHVAFYTQPAVKNMIIISLNTCEQFLKGNKVENLVFPR